jgi:TRAP-type mannitol/chloroaromatic compound transport system substrate-binding protein
MQLNLKKLEVKMILHKMKGILLLGAALMSINYAFAVEDNGVKLTAKSQATEQQDTKKIIDEYKAYLATIPAELRDEIVKYRTEIMLLNKKKKQLYKELSHAAQGYLKHEAEFKKRLPMKHRKFIAVESDAKK